MTVFKYLFLFLITFTMIDAEEVVPKRCGSVLISPDAKFNVEAKNVADCTKTLTTISDEYWPDGLILEIPVWFHVIYKSNGEGNVSDERINAQIEVLNEDYRALTGTAGSNGYDARIQFTLTGITRTQNDTWFDDDVDGEYKAALAVDTTKYVNMYSTSAGGYLGYAYFAQDSAFIGSYDGIVLLHSAVGGRDNGFSIYNQGRTLVHEMGHYLGLYHTFEGGSNCLNTYDGGDLVTDTPAESEEHYSCVQTTTCSTPDPIYNYMNYTNDECMNQFSAEQSNRMVCSVINYRPDIYTLIDTETTSSSINAGIISYLLN